MDIKNTYAKYERPIVYSKIVMANVQKLVEGQGHMLQIVGTARKALSQGTHMPNMNALSLRMKKLWPMLKISKVVQRSRSHVQHLWHCRRVLL